MVCDPSQNNINIPPPGPIPALPGLEAPFAVPGPPFPDVQIPDGIPEDLNDLIEKIFALFPQNIKFIPNTDSFMKGIWDALASLFNQLAPFLALYNFFQALLNIILCIIDVLCALMNPWATLKAVKRLFKECLPAFLSLFPWIALLIMILALILLLIELIIYLIQLIISYIEQIIKNIKVLAHSISRHDEPSIIAAVNKLAHVLCLIEGLFSMLSAIAAIIAIIEPLMGMQGRGTCNEGKACCTEDFCPDFIKGGGLDGQFSSSGQLIYYKEVGLDVDGDFEWMRNIPGFVQRKESWQMVDSDNENFHFVDIITPSPEYGFIYWPEGEVYEANANIVKIPYLLNFNVTVDPEEWGNEDDTGGERLFSIQDIVIEKKPTTHATNETGTTPGGFFDGLFDGSATGALSMVGGTVWEYDGEDGYTAYEINGEQASLNTFLSKEPRTTMPDDYDDGYYFSDIAYNFRPNHESLIDKKMITMMCEPDMGGESAVLNAEFDDHRSVFDKTGPLPDINGCIDCLNKSLSKFRGDLNEESAAVFEQEMTQCLTGLLDESTDFYCVAATAAADRYKSDFELDPETQFTGSLIDVTVTLRDKTGTQLGVGVTEEIGECIASGIRGEVTFGEVSDFEFDGYGAFTAVISSDEPGEGELRAYLSDEPFAEVLNREDIDTPSEIVERFLTYEFIDHTSVNYRRPDGDQYSNRFGAPDIAEDGS